MKSPADIRADRVLRDCIALVLVGFPLALFYGHLLGRLFTH